MQAHLPKHLRHNAHADPGRTVAALQELEVMKRNLPLLSQA